MKNALFPSLFSCFLISFLVCLLAGNARADDLLSSADSIFASAPASNSLSVDGSSESSLPPPDPDRGIVRSVHLEEAWVENAFYIHSVNQDQLSPGQEWSLSGEFDFAFNRWFGGDSTFRCFF
ncbi:hypothetical protein [Leptospirillum ferriphilum]|uniref:Uncharacterized protein n=1 Tax=Leptospirillum ferriphilum (strain ML-04) TaxID=1048260 RepID=J9ZD47_LEPFM|nr:hypothetical protein [Leptospirillum ferriphilum]AFS54101.1 hypothetical protein LFML04_1901 [Leptospirillum ferriphilum ML-04]